MTTTTTTKKAAERLIKKYPNRRLYDTETSTYITLSDVKQLVLDQEDFKVLDAKSNDDLTRSILLQIILEEESGGLPMRTVMCLRAYRRLPGLFDVAVLTTSVDAATEGVQGRFDAHGVSFANAMLLASHYLQGFAWKRSP